MRVWVLIYLIYDEPENPNASVYTTLKLAQEAEQRMLKEVEDDENFITSIVECVVN